eukprot:SAG31_NODE_3577_length_4103_cov_2.362637_4_plen_144_part_00
MTMGWDQSGHCRHTGDSLQLSVALQQVRACLNITSLFSLDKLLLTRVWGSSTGHTVVRLEAQIDDAIVRTLLACAPAVEQATRSAASRERIPKDGKSTVDQTFCADGLPIGSAVDSADHVDRQCFELFGFDFLVSLQSCGQSI